MDPYIWSHIFIGVLGLRSSLKFWLIRSVKDYDKVGVLWIQAILWNQKFFSITAEILIFNYRGMLEIGPLTYQVKHFRAKVMNFCLSDENFA